MQNKRVVKYYYIRRYNDLIKFMNIKVNVCGGKNKV